MQTDIHFCLISLNSTYNDKCFRQNCREARNTYFVFNNFFFENLAVCETVWKNIVERGSPRWLYGAYTVACWVPKAKNTHSGCVLLIAFPLQQWLHKRASILRHSHCACLVAYLTATCRLFLRPTQPPMRWLLGLWLPERDSGQWPSFNTKI